ncbi:MAG TPA: glycosyltransferase family 2 protein [Acidobacteriaceae bacterium]|nr:glycosyltransferase family 2 protein [Acidobacteriaceae bacterium]
MSPVLLQMRHSLAMGLGFASIVIAVVALLGTLYALAFALVGIVASRHENEDGETSAKGGDGFPTTNFLVVIPAHNEGSGLTATVESVLAQDYRHLRCVVVADNCTDNTAEMARAAGAHEVLIRTDPEKRGKGQALTWVFNLAKRWDWDAVCVIDADSVIEPGFLAALDRSFCKGHAAVQARYEFFPAADSKNWLQQFGAVSKAGENSFVDRPRERLGLSQLLSGNGFFVSRAVIERVPWLAHSIVEDAEYSLSLAQQGIAVHYQERARLWSRQASSVRDVQPQRVRWASGIGQLLRKAIPILLATAWRERNWRPIEEIVMLLMSSRLVLIYLWVLSFAMSLVAPSLFSITWSLLAGVAALQVLYLMLMFRFACDRPVPFAGALLLPYYVFVALSSHVMAMGGVNRHLWSRTSR